MREPFDPKRCSNGLPGQPPARTITDAMYDIASRDPTRARRLCVWAAKSPRRKLRLVSQ
jgi:hypothetical protein